MEGVFGLSAAGTDAGAKAFSGQEFEVESAVGRAELAASGAILRRDCFARVAQPERSLQGAARSAASILLISSLEMPSSVRFLRQAVECRLFMRASSASSGDDVGDVTVDEADAVLGLRRIKRCDVGLEILGELRIVRRQFRPGCDGEAHAEKDEEMLRLDHRRKR